MRFKEFRKLANVHGCFPVKFDFSNDDSIFNVENLFLDVLGMLEDPTLCFFKFVYCLLTVLDVFSNRKREPIVILDSLVHPSVELFNLLLK
jgi:hypothetical protein